MKIVYIYTALTTKGGVDRIISFKANYLTERYGYEVTIITDSQNHRELAFPLNSKVKHIDLGIDFGQQYKFGIIKRYICYYRLMRIYKRSLSKQLFNIQSDIVITTCGRDLDFLSNIKDKSIKIGEVHTVKESIRNLNIFDEKGFPYSLIAIYWRRKMCHNIKKLSSLIVLSKGDANSWKKIKAATIIPNPIPFKTDKISNYSAKRVISVGRFSKEKGYDLLIDAWYIVSKKHPDWELNIYGEGELEQEMNNKINLYSLNNSITLHSPNNNIAEKYSESSIYVMSSRYEGFGLVLIEAMSCGLPCISFNCPNGPSDIIKDGEDGILVEPNNVNKLAEKICYLIENYNIRKEMGRYALQNSKRYSPEIIMEKWDNLFKSLLIK